MLFPHSSMVGAGGQFFPVSAFDPTTAGADVVFSNGNLTAHNTNTAGNEIAFGNLSRPTPGKYYIEFSIDNYGGFCSVGSASTASSPNAYVGYGPNTNGWRSDGTWGGNVVGSSAQVTLTAYTTGDVISIAEDTTGAGAVYYFAKNGLWLIGGNPSAGTGGLPYGPAYSYIAASSDGGQITINSPFHYPPPAGFQPW